MITIPAVKCSVANCSFHGDNNDCHADAIMIDIAQHANEHFDQEIGTIEVDEKHIDYAKSRVDTLCHTFKAIN